MKEHSIKTLGYQGMALNEYLCRLMQEGVEILVDVRKNPLSRKPGFSKKALRAAMENAGICYLHIPELGVERKWRKDLKTTSDYEALFKRIRTELLPHRTEELSRLAELIKDGKRIALTCFEADPAICHRTLVAEALSEMTGASMVHL